MTVSNVISTKVRTNSPFFSSDVISCSISLEDVSLALLGAYRMFDKYNKDYLDAQLNHDDSEARLLKDMLNDMDKKIASLKELAKNLGLYA